MREVLRRRVLLAVVLLVTVCGFAAQARAQRESICTRGRPNAPLRVEIFSDYQCPSCGAFFLQTLRQVFTDYVDTGKVCVIYRDFMLQQHQHATKAAVYARAATRLGPQRWTRVAEALFQSQKEWAADGDVDGALAKRFSAEEMADLRREFNNAALMDEVGDDVLEGLRQQVHTPPTTVLTGRGTTAMIEGALRYDYLKSRMDALLNP